MEYINVHAAAIKAYQAVNTPTHLTKATSSSGKPVLGSASGAVGGLLAVIIIMALLGLALFIWAAYALYRFWRVLPMIAALASLILLLLGFAPFSLLVTYAAKRA